MTREIELKYRAERGRRFTSTEKSNVDVMVRAMTVTRQDERRTICGDVSQMMRGESTTGSLSGEPLLSILPPNPNLDKAKEGCGETSSENVKKNSAPGAPHSHSQEDQKDPYDDWR